MKYALVVTLFLSGLSPVIGQAPSQRLGLPRVVVARVVEAEVSMGQRVVGTVEPLRSSTIGSAVDGRVVQFLVDHGEAVRKGQSLAQLRTETLEIELAAAQAELRLDEQRLAELENGSRPEDIAESRARMLGAKAAMTNAANQFRRVETLLASRAASSAELEDARERAEFTRHALAATEALLKRIEEGPRVEQIAQAKAQVDLRIQRVQLIEDRISKHTIVSPFDGFVSQEFTEIGAWISQGDPVVEVIELDEVEILIPTTAEYAVRIRRGDMVRVEFPELPAQLLLTGKVHRVVPVADSRARTFPVYVHMANPMRDGVPMLMAGMLARVELSVGQRQSMPLVPKDALVLNGQHCTLFVVDQGAGASSLLKDSSSGRRTGSVHEIHVELGVAVGGLIQVKGRIAAGDLVVVTGNERLRDKDEVEITEVSANEQRTLEAGLTSMLDNNGPSRDK